MTATPVVDVRSPARYQLLPPLAEPEYAALKADIAAHGVLIPIELDEAGAVLDGHHRLRACQELGITTYQRVIRAGLSEEAKREHVLRLNLLRRHLGPVGWAEAFRKLADVRGVAVRLQGPGGRPAGNADTLTALAAELGVGARTARRRLALADVLTPHPDLAAAVDRGDLAATRARATAHIRDGRARLAELPAHPLAPTIELRAGDFRTALSDLPEASVDLVFTDPPYLAESIPLYGDLADLAARVLRPGGLLIAYAGQAHLPAVLEALSAHLAYAWCGAIVYAGGNAVVRHRHIRVGWKPLCFFARAPLRAGPWFADMVTSRAREKTLHPWQQTADVARYYIGRLTRPGDLVLDPFLGSGTTALAAQSLGRRCIGAELDPETLAVARQRLAAASDAPPDPEDYADAVEIAADWRTDDGA